METPPPLPEEDPPNTPSPPSSMQASNQSNERLDFETDAGGSLCTTFEPPYKRARLSPEDLMDIEEQTEGPDTLLGSGLAAELLEEGEIFDSESILSRNSSINSEKSRAHSQDNDLAIQVEEKKATQEKVIPSVVSEDQNSQNSVSVSEISNDILSLKDEPVSVLANNLKEPSETPTETPTETPVAASIKDYLSDDEKEDDDMNHAQITSEQPEKEISLKPTIPSQDQGEFEIIDDVESDLDDFGNDQGSIERDSDVDSEDLLYDEDEIDALLDEEMQKTSSGKAEQQTTNSEGVAVPLQKDKVVLVEKGIDPFDILPEGWVVIAHNSGMPIYLHRKSRVCTLSRPYFLGPGSARRHDIPVSAIPCLQYRRALDNPDPILSDDEAASKSQSQTATCTFDKTENNTAASTNNVDAQPSEEIVSKLGVRVETAKDHEKQNSLNAEEVKDYCAKLFEFKTITVKRFKTWKDRRKHNNLLKKVSRPSLPSSTKLIRCTIPADNDNKTNKRKEFILNPAGKSYICILHEYVQQALRVQPRYVFQELANSQTPFSSTIMIQGERYGTGYSSSKKGAKLEAAKATLAILIPEINKLKQEENQEDNTTSDLTLFDTIKIEDPRITELCIKAGQPGPFQVLCECLKRNYGVGDTQVQMEMKALRHQRSEFIMKVGKHEAKVVCKNKREGKQQAAQAILQKMHPHIHTWGSLLRLYDRSVLAKDEGAPASPCLYHHVLASQWYGLDDEDYPDINSQQETVLLTQPSTPENKPFLVDCKKEILREEKKMEEMEKAIQTDPEVGMTPEENGDKVVMKDDENVDQQVKLKPMKVDKTEKRETRLQLEKYVQTDLEKYVQTDLDPSVAAARTACKDEFVQTPDIQTANQSASTDSVSQLNSFTQTPQIDPKNQESQIDPEDFGQQMPKTDFLDLSLKKYKDQQQELLEFYSEIYEDYKGPKKMGDGNWRHRATQTGWEGIRTFHKTTQFPDMDYTIEDQDTTTTMLKEGSLTTSGDSVMSRYQCVAVRSGSKVIIGTAPIRTPSMREISTSGRSTPSESGELSNATVSIETRTNTETREARQNPRMATQIRPTPWLPTQQASYAPQMQFPFQHPSPGLAYNNLQYQMPYSMYSGGTYVMPYMPNMMPSYVGYSPQAGPGRSTGGSTASNE